MLPYWKRIHVIALIASALVFVPNTASAQTLPQGVTKASTVEGITEYRLANGLKVLLFPDQSKPTITVNITYLVGSRQENYGETGMAHLLEHMLFKGTPKHLKLSQELQNRGARFNGTTSRDRTNYYELLQASDDNVKWAIDMEADRMVNSFIARKDLDTEMTVVRNEFERGENSPFSILMKHTQSIAYDWHNYGNATIGNRSDIENVEIANLQAFYHTYYQPDNAVLLIAGKFDAIKTLGWITKAFAPITKPKRHLPVQWTVEPTQDGERNFTVRRKGDTQIIMVTYKTPSALHPDADALDFAGEILTDTPTGRLHKQLVDTGKAAEVFTIHLSGYAPGLQIIGAIVKKDEAVEPVRDALIAAIENFYKTPPTKEEMERVRANSANQLEKALNDHEEIGVALSETIALGDWRLLFYSRDQLSKITAEQVSAAASYYFKRDNRTVGIFLPEDKPARTDIPTAPTPTALLKDYKPQEHTSLAEAFDPSQDNINTRTQLSKVGGIDLALLPKKNRGETVAVAFALHWGDEKSLFGKQTIASMTSAMLTRGNSKFSREQLADEFTRLKITGSIFNFETTREHLADALRLVSQVLTEPTFPLTEFEQLRKQTIVSTEATRNEPGALAGQALAQHFNHYPKGDWRAAQTIDDAIASVKAVSLDDIKAFHKNFYGATKAELAIIGDFDAVTIKQVVANEFGNWKSSLPYARIDDSYIDIPAVHQSIDTPDKENGFYMARMNLNMRDTDPAFPAMYIADEIFGGGGMNSRLLNRIRQKDGLSYGGNSSLNIGTLDAAGSYSIGAIAAPQNLARLEIAIQEELVRVLKDGFTADEVAQAKSSLLQKRVQARAQDNILAHGWISYLYLGRTYVWSKALEEKIKALSTDDVTAAFRKLIDPTKMTVVIAGDAAKMKAVKAP